MAAVLTSVSMWSLFAEENRQQVARMTQNSYIL